MAYFVWRYVLYLVLGIFCIIFNSIEISIIIWQRKVMKTFELILLSLSFADFIVGLSMAIIGASCIHDDEEFFLSKTKPLSYVIFTINVFAVFSSVTNILGISVERLLAVRCPIEHAIWMSRRKAKWVILLIWTLSIVLTLVVTVSQLMSSRSTIGKSDTFSPGYFYTMAITIILLGVVFVFIYIYIVWKIIIRKEEFRKTFKGSTICRRCDDKLYCKIMRARTLLLTCSLVVLAYIGCTYPVAIIFLGNSGKLKTLPDAVMLIIVNSALNPFIYFLKGFLEKRSSKRLESSVKTSSTLVSTPESRRYSKIKSDDSEA